MNNTLRDQEIDDMIKECMEIEPWSSIDLVDHPVFNKNIYQSPKGFEEDFSFDIEDE